MSEPTIKTEVHEENDETLINPSSSSDLLGHGSNGSNTSTTRQTNKSPAQLPTTVHDAMTGAQLESEDKIYETVENNMVESTIPMDSTVVVKTENESTPVATPSREEPTTSTTTQPMLSLNSNNCQTPAYTGENIPDNFFDELSNDADQITDQFVSVLKNEPQGDELDNIPTPCQSPHHHNVNPDTNLESADHEAQPITTNQQVNVKSEVNGGEVRDESETIPENFFDGLLDDRISARVAVMNSASEEMKYADQLRQRIRELDEAMSSEEETPSDIRQKKKKSKKKSRKRSRSKDKNKKSDSRESGEQKHKRNKRLRSPLIDDQENITNVIESIRDIIDHPVISTESNHSTARKSTSHCKNVDDEDVSVPPPKLLKTEEPISDDEIECLTVRYPTSSNNMNAYSGFKKIKLEKCSQMSNEKQLAPITKREKAMNAAAEAIKQFQAEQGNFKFSSFDFVSTVRKLPTSNSYVTQHIYDNRSPLHTINNVQYAFNSHSTRFNLHGWGLEKLPKIAANVAKIVGYDADRIFTKLQFNKLTNKFNKIKREHNEANRETVDETQSSFFTNAMTQTDEDYFTSARRRNARDIGTQVTSCSSSVGTQTAPVASNDDLPLMRLINILNENQLIALTDFAELIQEPASNAMDIYRLRQRMQEIYKCSQLPSAIPAAAPTVNPPAPKYNNYKQRDPRAAYRPETHPIASQTVVPNPAYNYPATADPNPAYNYSTTVANRAYAYQNNGSSGVGIHHGVQPYHNMPLNYQEPPLFTQAPAAKPSLRGYGRGRKPQ